ncbi:hypothetical protein [Burkholderia ubonensis]|uniref:hypothetical protein n=1 Tax=Burkholderia ubonensis TaxID=101571 RepID=UPI0012F85EC9|nr:hypothetical protein [Burkholderia ubonensis]
MTSLQGKRAVIAGLVTVSLVVLAGGVALSSMLKQQPAKTAKVTKEEPANPAGSSIPAPAPGCWDVALNNGVELVATWVSECSAAAPAILGDQAWPQGTIRLPALSSKEPPMAQAQLRAVLSEDLAQHGAGAMLYLPANSDGSGYYVAAWAKEEAPAEEAATAPGVQRGLQVGLYGAPPTSVATPGGRVYLSTEFSPRGRPAGPEVTLHGEDTEANSEDESPQEAESSAETAAASARVSSTF